jgi:Arc/MetJ-type ribon-helix-helix transcriptional regulator
MTVAVQVRLAERDLAALDRLVEKGVFANRSGALRAGLTRLLREHREQEIDEAYRRGYEAYPQGDWVAEVGLAGLASLNRAERGGPL